MQRNNFDPAGTTQASLNLDRYRPTVVVWPNSRPGSGSTIPDKPPKPYPILDGKAVVARWIGDHATFHFAKTDDPESLLEDGPPTKNTDFHPSKSEVRFYPQGIDSLAYIPIKGSTCVYTNADGSHLLRPNGVMQGPYPWHPQLSMRPAPTPSPTNPSQGASEVSSQHPGLRFGLSGDFDDFYSGSSRTVNPLDLIRDPTITNDSGYCGSVRDSISNKDQRVKYRRPCDQSSNDGAGDADPWGSFDAGLGDQPEYTGGQFPEIGAIEWGDDILE